MIHAYFIGGPQDLTKQALREAVPVIYFALLHPLSLAQSRDELYATIAPVHTGKVCYERRSQVERDVYVYVYKGEV